MLNYVLGPLLSLLPKEWRVALAGHRAVNWPRAAFISGVLCMVVFAVLFVWWYLHYLQVARDQQVALVWEAMSKAKDIPPGITQSHLRAGVGLSAVLAVWMHPLTLTLLYFTVEGLLRTLGAYLSDESPGTLPLVLIAGVIAMTQRRAYERRVPLIPDEAIRSEDPAKTGWDLQVASCRPKRTWKYPLTIRYEDEYFQVVGETSGGTGARPHVYQLRRPPPGEAYRGVVEFDPAAVLQQEARKNILVQMYESYRDRWRLHSLPRVRDIVVVADGKQGWHLKVESCRPKPMWTPGRTIRYEERFYSVTSQYEARAPMPGEQSRRPFGFLLRLVPENVAIRGPLEYSPDDVLSESD